jgi:lipoprotein-releasing system ATP-binding protein
MRQGNLLHLQGVSKSYPGPNAPVQVLKRIDLEIAPGTSVAITGPSGSGKTTLLNLIGTLDSPDSGEIRIDDTDIATLSPEALSEFRLMSLGLVFQRHHLLPQCTALENVLFPTIPTSQNRGEVLERARTLFARAGLGQRMDHFPGQLSGGERQRVAVLRALINRPKLLLADEPTGALDKQATAELLALLHEFNREGMTIIMVTHSSAAADAMQQRFVLDDGTLLKS